MPKKTFACSGTGCNLGSSETNSLLALGSERQKVGTWQRLLLRLCSSWPEEMQIQAKSIGTKGKNLGALASPISALRMDQRQRSYGPTGIHQILGCGSTQGHFASEERCRKFKCSPPNVMVSNPQVTACHIVAPRQCPGLMEVRLQPRVGRVFHACWEGIASLRAGEKGGTVAAWV